MATAISPPARKPAQGIDDATLVGRARSGDAWALDALLRRHADEVLAIATRLLGRRDEADDVAQDVFATVITDLHDLREPAAYRSWLLGITIRRVRRAFRQRKLRRLFGIDRSQDDTSFLEQASPDATPEMRAELALIDAMIAKLPAEERIAWILRRVEGEELREIARITGSSLATVKRRVDAVDVRLRAQIDRGGSP